MSFQKIVLILMFCLSSLSSMAYNSTPDYWMCEGRVSGKWIFGVAPYGCNADTFLKPDYIDSLYSSVILKGSSLVERELYVSNLYAVLKDLAIYYLDKRNSSASEEEKRIWINAVLTIAHQESYFSHFRIQENRLKIMRGDKGHGHGIMQVDDRWHFPKIQNGEAWDLVDNILYSLEEYYRGWILAPKKSCVDGEYDYVGRSRAAYSYYNGGPSKICRWINPNDTWARNDIGFYDKFQNRSWERYIRDLDIESPVDIECVAEGRDNCEVSDGDGDFSYDEEILYLLDDERSCFYDGTSFKCISSFKGKECLSSYLDREIYKEKRLESIDDSIDVVNYDQHELCRQTMPSVFQVGDSLKVHKNINIRATPGGAKLGTVLNASTFEVSDFWIKENNYKRYYLINYKGIKGYIYCGDKESFRAWATKDLENSSRVIPRINDFIKVVSSNGVILRNSVDGEEISIISEGEILQVNDIVIKGRDNRIYIEINEGSIYAGSILPDAIFLEIVQISRELKKVIGCLKKDIYFRTLLDCNNQNCQYLDKFILGPKVSKRYNFEILDNLGEYTKIKLLESGKEGWLYSKDIYYY